MPGLLDVGSTGKPTLTHVGASTSLEGLGRSNEQQSISISMPREQPQITPNRERPPIPRKGPKLQSAQLAVPRQIASGMS